MDPLTTDIPLGSDPLSVRRRIEVLERLLEGLVEIPVLRRKVGLDAIAGVVPVVGDLLTAGLGLYLVWEARNLGLPKWQLWRMAANVGFDSLIGAVPVAGDLFDLLYRSNTRNLRIIRKHLDRHHPATKVIET
ncbi:DUF4112 domain-containing protein [Novosphingobium sp.]|uniref:DUF4112 domain-containing protein n=1 Tax=Novosphingobium sp. TaxID=1874826 RepID=UPI0022C8B173|nr:DUF4112 domain-containing protein [Novosphingobium sp.]MCZ8018789.1 DUF4112 domain-containing protein [Novosphingobium sp.]MCZ8034794.1 DUF4112 domain-containing protein [Novosphingobium sp.]MCZ8052929.1 DUF4112 domain-containing protein [Novosphingobium sp.]MCZ8060687.1 DUF4112 domain-containing protein [Novosphingobium sp.]MCZ8233230.1 DUF4112 domain-containing protein [Novosphingobium sp.]